jgi:stearoyl-CoA desaturase (delta-9 desaturase)
MRLWLWLTTGMNTKEWVAVHRLHHQKTDTPEDPHSPKIYGIIKVLFLGAVLYYNAAKDKKMIDKLGHGTPNDWIENNLYTPYTWLGVIIMLIIDCLLFGWAGLLIWIIQMIWIPFWAAGVVNGFGHYIGYRNGHTDDTSKNIFPIGIIIGGEELHNNHHLDPASARLSRRWFEVDLGWIVLQILARCKLATIRN